MKNGRLAVIGFIVAQAMLWGAVPAFKLGPLVVAPGEIKTGKLIVPERGGTGTFIPVTVAHGVKPGPVLALVAGTHGFEYPPILALQRLKDTIDPKALSGTLIIVHIANLPSFSKRTIYFNPSDGKNLNRVFPGDPNGSLSQRIAFVLTQEVVRRADVLIDMHCGDGNEALVPYSYWMISGDAALDERTRALALAFGLSPIIIDTTRGRDPLDSKYLGNTALLMGKPAITTEAGYLGRSDEDDIQRNLRGAWSVLRHLGMVGGKPDRVENPVWIDRYEVVMSGRDGLFFPRLASGSRVEAGQTVGIIKDFWGAIVEEVRAPFAGIILYILGTPPCNAGEPLYEVGRIK
jgi:hypothetical protein